MKESIWVAWFCTKIEVDNLFDTCRGCSAELADLRTMYEKESQAKPEDTAPGRSVGSSSSFLAGPNRGRSTRRTRLASAS